MVLISLRVFSLTRSIAGVFAEPFRVLSRKKCDSKKCVALELVPLRGEKNFKQHVPTNEDHSNIYEFF